MHTKDYQTYNLLRDRWKINNDNSHCVVCSLDCFAKPFFGLFLFHIQEKSMISLKCKNVTLVSKLNCDVA